MKNLLLLLTFLSCNEFISQEYIEIEKISGFNYKSEMVEMDLQLSDNLHCTEEWNNSYGVSREYAKVCDSLGFQSNAGFCNKSHICSNDLDSSVKTGFRDQMLPIGRDFIDQNTCLVYGQEVTCSNYTPVQELTHYEESFIDQCESAGLEVYRCGCSNQYICSDEF